MSCLANCFDDCLKTDIINHYHDGAIYISNLPLIISYSYEGRIYLDVGRNILKMYRKSRMNYIQNAIKNLK